MARIPTRTAQRSIPGVQSARVINTDGGLSNAVGNLGNAVGQFADRQRQLDERKTAIDNQREDFRIKTEFERFRIGANADLDDEENNISVDGAGFRENFVEGRLKQRREEFLASVPERLRERYTELAGLETERLNFSAARRERDQEQGFYRNEIGKVQEDAIRGIDQSPENFETFRNHAEEFIRESRLPNNEKQELLESWRSRSAEQRDISRLANEPGVAEAITGDFRTGSAALIKEKEGFITEAKWDVNAYRVGYGSDTVTRADGTVEKVTKDTVVTRADAERDLRRRIGEFKDTAISNVGEEAWNNLPANAQSALLSITYNYGEIPKRIREQVKSGDLNAIAEAVLGLQGDNDGINAGRRESEAAIILGGSLPDSGVTLAGSQRVQKAAQQQAKNTRAQEVAGYNSRLESLKFAVATGGAGQEEINAFARDEEQIAFSDFDKLNTELRQFEAQQKEEIDFVQAFSDPDRIFDPSNSEDKKIIETAYASIIDNGDIREEQVAQTALSLIRRVNTVPKGFEGQVKALIDSNDAQQVRQGFDLLDRVYAINPQVAIRDFSTTTVERLQDYRALQGFLGDEDLIKATRSSGDIATDTVRAEREKAADKVSSEVEIDELLEALDPGIFAFEPEAPADSSAQGRLMLDYRNLYRERFARTNNAEQSRQDALDLLGTRWGISGVNGGRLTRFPPENDQPQIRGSHEWMQKQLEEKMAPFLEEIEVSEFTGPGPKTTRNVMPQLAIVATRLTEKDAAAGRPLRYKVLARESSGLFGPVYNDQNKEAVISFDASELLKKERQRFSQKRKRSQEIESRIQQAINSDELVRTFR